MWRPDWAPASLCLIQAPVRHETPPHDQGSEHNSQRPLSSTDLGCHSGVRAAPGPARGGRLHAHRHRRPPAGQGHGLDADRGARHRSVVCWAGLRVFVSFRKGCAAACRLGGSWGSGRKRTRGGVQDSESHGALVGLGRFALIALHPCTESPAIREASTMPQWAGSCWYYLRYIDPDNSSRCVWGGYNVLPAGASGEWYAAPIPDREAALREVCSPPATFNHAQS